MNKYEKGIQKLQKLQKQLEKQYKKISKLSKNTHKELPALIEAKSSYLNKVEAIATSPSLLNKKTKKILFVLCGAAVLYVFTAFVVSRVKKLKMNFDDNTRFDVAYGDAIQDHAEEFDFEHASLEELEEALFRVENELNEVSAAIEKNKN